MTRTSTPDVKSAGRILDVLELLVQGSTPMTQAQIARVLSIPKSSLSQLVGTLLARGYLSYREHDKTYHPGPGWQLLATAARKTPDIVELSLPLLKQLTDQLKESSALNLLRGEHMEVVASQSSERRLVSHMRLGDKAPLYAVSSGKVALAFMRPSACEDYLDHMKPEQHTPRTVVDREELISQIHFIREQGVGFSFEEYTWGVIGIAVPVLDTEGYAQGVLSVAMPAVHYSEEIKEGAIELLRAAALRLSERMNYWDSNSIEAERSN
ncbi:IclR family transcriptional regulator [Pseudomonas fluorescens]|uniref:IclR family transcriptional regulator n=1 Tax=Pseudomonas fluorescens TaxID=294 RepID=UPI0019126F91|nr:IclR family transcriptional regulator [Pseudomonas fluorescens]